MTRDINIGTRNKNNVVSYTGRVIEVARNHEAGTYTSGPTTRILSLYMNGEFNETFDLDQAIALRDAITEVILDAEQIIEDAKPKTLDSEQLLGLKTGSIVYADGSSSSIGAYREFVKTSEGNFVKIKGDSMVGQVYDSFNIAGFVYMKEDK